MAKKKVTKKATSKKANAKKTTTKKKVTKKASTKKKAAAKKSNRPSYSASAAASQKMAQRDSMYIDFKEPCTHIGRIQPRLDGDSSIFVKSVLHYKMKDADDPTRGIALGCLKFHGNKETGKYCYLCAVAEWLAARPEKKWQDLGRGFGSIEANENLKIQLWLLNVATKEWEGPKLLTVPSGPKGIAPKLTGLLSTNEDMGTAPFVDFDKGQAIAMTRIGTGRSNTSYEVSSTGQFISMDEVDPNWQDSIFKDVPAKLDVKVWDIDEQKRTLHLSMPDLPWDLIEEEIG